MKTLTKTANAWFTTATSGLRADQIAVLDSAMRQHSDRRRSPRVGGNHVLKALIDTGLYQRTWP